MPFLSKICWLFIDIRSASWPFFCTDVIAWFGYNLKIEFLVDSNRSILAKNNFPGSRDQEPSLLLGFLQIPDHFGHDESSLYGFFLLTNPMEYFMWQDSCFCWLVHP